MIIVIAIRDIWQRYDHDSLVLGRVGVCPKAVIKLAFGFACLSCQSEIAKNIHSIAAPNVFNAVNQLIGGRDLDINRLPAKRQSIYDPHFSDTYRIVDIVGEISRMLVDAVIRQIGSFPARLTLHRFIGHDIVLKYPED